jgi:selenocysteine-specific translation elongation factor
LKINNTLKEFKTKRKIRIDLFFKNLKLVEDVVECFVDVDSFE